MAQEEHDDTLEEVCDKDIEKLAKEVGELEFKNMLKDEDDVRDAILLINSGAGGTEAQELKAQQ